MRLSSLSLLRSVCDKNAAPLLSCSSLNRLFASASNSDKPNDKKGKPSSIVEPSYTYLPPGSSMMEPHLISLTEPHYVDPTPSTTTATNTSAPRPSRSPKGASKLQTEDISQASKMVANPAGPFNGRRGSLAEPTYTYGSPGSSMKEPWLSGPNSLSEPTFTYPTTPPAAKSGSAPPAAAKVKVDPASLTKEQAASKLPFASISGAKGKAPEQKASGPDSGSGKHPYRMRDEFAQQTYVVKHGTNSMGEPRYSSISDPALLPNERK